MKIGVVRNDLAAAGGAERYTLSLLGRLLELGHEVHVFTARGPVEPMEGLHLHVASTPLRRTVRVGPLKIKMPRLPRAWRHLSNQRWLKQAVREQGLDVLLTMERMVPSDVFRAGGGVHAAWLDICSQRATPWQKIWGRIDPMHRQVLKAEKQVFCTANTRLLICISRMVAEEVERYYGFPRERIRVIYNGIDLEQWCPSPASERDRLRLDLGMPLGEPALLFVGTGWWRKGLDIAINVLGALHAAGLPARLYVVGRGEPETFRQQAAQLGVGDYVTFVGQVDPGAVLPWYQAADAFLFPSRYDPLAVACLEANATGLPVIVGPRTGFSELVKDGVNGLVLPDEWDGEELAARIGKLMMCSNRRTVRAQVAHLDLPSHVDAVLEVLEEAQALPRPAGLGLVPPRVAGGTV